MFPPASAAVIRNLFAGLDRPLRRHWSCTASKSGSAVELETDPRGKIENANGVRDAVGETVVGKAETMCGSAAIEVEADGVIRGIGMILEQLKVASVGRIHATIVVVQETVEQARCRG